MVKAPGKRPSVLEATFALHCKAHKIPVQPEYRFAPPRRWLFDFALPDQRIAIELEGGIWTNGRHVRGKGMIEDMEKYNEAARRGWAVFRFHGDAVQDGTAIQFLLAVLKERSSPIIPMMRPDRCDAA